MLDCALLEPDFYCLSAQAIQTMTRRLGKASSISLKHSAFLRTTFSQNTPKNVFIKRFIPVK